MILKIKNKPVALIVLTTLGILAATLGASKLSEQSQLAISDNECLQFIESVDALNIKNIESEQFSAFTSFVDSMITSSWNLTEEVAQIKITDCKNYLNTHFQEIEQDFNVNNQRICQKFGKVSLKTRQFVEEILTDFDIDIKKLPIVKYEAKNFLAGVDDFVLFISEDNMKDFSPESQRFVIAHELIHYKHKDQSVETALNKLLDPANSVHTKCIDSFTLATEYRADIYAMLKDAQYTKGAMIFFKEYIEKYGDFESKTHPGPSERLRLAQDIHAKYELTEANNPAIKA